MISNYSLSMLLFPSLNAFCVETTIYFLCEKCDIVVTDTNLQNYVIHPALTSDCEPREFWNYYAPSKWMVIFIWALVCKSCKNCFLSALENNCSFSCWTVVCNEIIINEIITVCPDYKIWDVLSY